MSSKQEIKRIEPEKVETPQMERPDYSYGYKDRPINQKRGVYNTYLDSCKITKEQQIPIPGGSGEYVKIVGYGKLQVGNINFIPSADDITIPINGTYTILAKFFWTDGFGDFTQPTYYEIRNNGTAILSEYKPTLTTFENINIIGMENLSKGDLISIYVSHDESNIRTVDVSLTITKIS